MGGPTHLSFMEGLTLCRQPLRETELASTAYNDMLRCPVLQKT